MKRITSLAAVAFALLTGAQASTINYAFTQGGFVDSAGDAGTLSGTFSATPEAGGLVQLGDLTSFSATFSETVNGEPDSFVFNVANDFSYDPLTPGSLSFSTGSTQSGIVACTGGADVNAVCLGLTAPAGVRSSATGFFEDLPGFGASLAFQPSVVTVTGGSGAATPEPGTSVLLATGALLMTVGSFRRRTTEKNLATLS
jgi:hypothetical protein